jgi:hypothetical protein
MKSGKPHQVQIVRIVGYILSVKCCYYCILHCILHCDLALKTCIY